MKLVLVLSLLLFVAALVSVLLWATGLDAARAAGIAFIGLGGCVVIVGLGGRGHMSGLILPPGPQDPYPPVPPLRGEGDGSILTPQGVLLICGLVLIVVGFVAAAFM